MKRLFAASVLAFAVGAMVLGQGGAAPKYKPVTSPSAQKDTRPVTVKEATLVFSKTREAMVRGFGVSLPPNLVLSNGPRSWSHPVTREQVVAQFTHFLNVMEPDMKLTPEPVHFDPSVLKIGRTQMKPLEALIRYGFVAKVGPVATGPKDSLTVHEFGDAIGFFLARMALLTNMPNPKWTPALGAGA